MRTSPAQSAMGPICKSRQGHGDGVVPSLHLMEAMRAPVLVAALMLAACGPPGEIPGTDAGDDTPDGATGMAGLEIRWSATGLGENGDATIDRIRLFLRDLRATGDATSGNEAHRPRLDLEFRSDGSGPPVEPVEFRQAPPGRYSAFEFQLARPMDGELSWSVDGGCDVDDSSYDLEIEDEDPLSISLPLDLLLEPGDEAVLEVQFAADLIVEGVDWSQGNIEDDTLVVDD